MKAAAPQSAKRVPNATARETDQDEQERSMNQIEISAKMAKTSIDAKKAVLTLELEYDSWSQIPNLARMTGESVNVVMYPSQTSMDV